MKRITCLLTILIFACSVWAGMHTYTDASVLREGNFVKIRVSETGVHILTYETLESWGLKPAQLRILGYGGGMLSENFTLHHWDDLPSVAFYMHKGADGVFNAGDYVLFYAQGPVTWTSDKQGRWRHTQHPYSHYGYYFLSDNAGEQRLINMSEAFNGDMSDVIDVDWYTNYQVHEKDEVNLIDLTGVSGGGREFYGEMLNANNKTLTLNFASPNVRTDIKTHCYIDLAGITSEPTTLTVNLAGQKANCIIPAINVSDYYTKAEQDSVWIETNAQNNSTQTVQLSFSGRAAGAKAYLNYVEINIPCKLTMQDNALSISNTTLLGTSKGIRFHMTNANNQTQIWRVTDGVNIEQIPTAVDNNTLSWVGNNTTAEKYVAVNVANANNWKIPTLIGKVENQNLHALSNIDYVIICPKDFVEPATRLAQKHEEIDQLTWAVVTDEQVYNEFSSGTPDVTAYRWLMKMLYDKAKGMVTAQPKSLLLLGDGTFDNRKILVRSGENKLLTFQAKNSTIETQAYGTDDYCGFLLDNAGIDNNGIFNETRAQMNIGVGRLPVKTLDEANQVVDKICTYMDNQVLGKWKTQICFFADDGDHGLHVQTAESGAEKMRLENLDFVVNKIYLDAYTQEVSAAGESYPLAKNQFDNLLNKGMLFMNYSGHGGYNNITNELFMTMKDIQNMKNINQGFWFLATCSFSHFDAGITSAGEEAVLNPNGGAIGTLSACRTVYATQNTIFNRNLCDTLFGHKDAFNYHMTLGEATRVAKNMTGRDANKMAYILLADPALRLKYPTDYQVKTITDIDTLHALSVQTIKGYIETPDHDTATWFNGQVDITIYDKMQEITTRDNDETNESLKVKITYNDYPNTLFSGQTTVVDGLFEFTFMVPKDIRYNYGNGRITYYAYDTEAKEEGIGHFEDFVIGGSSSVEIQDTIGPDIHMYINSPEFQDGGTTYEFPHFYANIYDENGINTVGTGIGHDLLMIVDGNPKHTYVLNDYFIASNNSYQQGQVSYKMPEMEEGAHTLTFRAWDLLNNSSTAMLNFQVVKGQDPQIQKVITYPNPVGPSDDLIFHIDHDQPDEIIETTINLYDLSGRMIHTHAQRGVDGIRWNISELGINGGIYVYQVNIKTTTSNYVSKAGKIIVSK